MLISSNKCALAAVAATMAISIAMPTMAAEQILIGGDFSGNYYQVVYTDDIAYLDAKTAAATHTYNSVVGRLATIEGKTENDFLSALVLSQNEHSYWVGGERRSGNWTWITDDLFGYTNWKPGQPDGDGSYLEFHAAGTWNDLSSSAPHGYLVEYANAAIPAPGAFLLVLAGLGSFAWFKRRLS